MKILPIIFIVLFATSIAAGQSTMVKIKTSAVCEKCKEIIEHNLSFEKGIKTAKVDLDGNTVNVTYNPSKTSEEKIRIALTKIGYVADSMTADPKAFNKLPDCCKMPGQKHH